MIRYATAWGIAWTMTTSLLAQTVSATATAGNLPVSATYAPARSIPAGTDLTAGGSVSTTGAGPLGTTMATTTLHPLVTDEYEVAATLIADVAANANAPLSQLQATCGTLWATPVGRNDVLLRLSATTTVFGRFEVTFIGSANWQASTLHFVDVMDDGTYEASAHLPTQPLTPVSFGPGTLPVRLSSYAGGQLSAEHWSFAETGTLEVKFVPDSRCVATITSPPCGAIRLRCRQNFTLGTDQHVTGLRPPGQSLAVLVYGFAPASSALPLPPGCLLTNDATAPRLLQQDPGGEAMHSIRSVPPALRPMQIFAQAIELDASQGTATTSESVRIDCH